MKLLYVNNTSFLSGGGGGEERANEITKRLAANGHEVTVLAGKTDPELPNETVDQGRRFRHVTCVPVFVFKYGSLGYFLSRYLFAFVSLPIVIGLLYREEFDAIAETMTPYPTFVVLAAKLFGVPIVATRHEFFDRSCYDVYDPLTATIQLTVQNFLRIFEYNAIVVPATHVKQQFVDYGVPEERLTVIPNGVEYERYRRPAIESEPGRLVVVGRLTKRKRQDRLVRVVRRLRDEGSDVRLDVAGDGPARERLEQMVEELDLDGCVTVHGFVDEERKIELLNRAELFVFASTQEGFGIVLLEAMAAGLPVVAKRLPVYEDFFVDGENGYLIQDDGSGTDEFADAIQQLLDAPAIEEETKARNMRTAEHYSWNAVTDQTEAVLAATIA
ncbi:glycosyltransferase family 4 protein [Halococcus sediminicola]|uniref:glycosyltransferase family 4 protein n=1 Tax=Halococcus sediminicola TaxID=1264579 RepID=UPI0006797866|nr:glycosyltransferase family 4 protein [Halococcus sediminicola]